MKDKIENKKSQGTKIKKFIIQNKRKIRNSLIIPIIYNYSNDKNRIQINIDSKLDIMINQFLTMNVKYLFCEEFFHRKTL